MFAFFPHSCTVTHLRAYTCKENCRGDSHVSRWAMWRHALPLLLTIFVFLFGLTSLHAPFFFFFCQFVLFPPPCVSYHTFQHICVNTRGEVQTYGCAVPLQTAFSFLWRVHAPTQRCRGGILKSVNAVVRLAFSRSTHATHSHIRMAAWMTAPACVAFRKSK